MIGGAHARTESGVVFWHRLPGQCIANPPVSTDTPTSAWPLLALQKKINLEVKVQYKHLGAPLT